MKNRKSNVLTIIKKELQRFFGDRRMLFGAVLLPGLTIFVVYSLMGTFLSDRFSVGEDEQPLVYVSHAPASLAGALDALPVQLIDATDGDGSFAMSQAAGGGGLRRVPGRF